MLLQILVLLDQGRDQTPRLVTQEFSAHQRERLEKTLDFQKPKVALTFVILRHL